MDNTEETSFENFVGLVRSKEEISMWVEKYRPKSLDEYIGNPSLINSVKEYIRRGELTNHVLLHGPQGTGKTTIAKLLVKSIPCDCLFICASDETGVENVRDKIKGFASTVGFNRFKIVLCDECLDEETLVTVLRDGEVTQLPIKLLNDGNDLVMSLNMETEKIEWRPFTLEDKGLREVYEIELENDETIVCTDTHKWYVTDPDSGERVRMPLKDIVAKNIQEILTK
jgi:energy-coupling factor transporter ATP-binding protein EcfA2